ncbi:hypothetical protein GJ744_011984 [Endocarpon pusillum]|uniref:Uncharacterized protein n=1 Tax=Endocarpon pusillum TaxID=364733 RepID=A0A8H7ATI2_9EURO|nr:hypothetical protein GJ744_011984 [Endocarpon pusillum]
MWKAFEKEKWDRAQSQRTHLDGGLEIRNKQSMMESLDVVQWRVIIAKALPVLREDFKLSALMKKAPLQRGRLAGLKGDEDWCTNALFNRIFLATRISRALHLIQCPFRALLLAG